MARAFLVVGGESTGTRLVTELCLVNGCSGSKDHDQPWDSEMPSPSAEPLIVWRRSIPHGAQGPSRHFPHPSELVDQLDAAGYSVTVLVTTRCWRAAAKSQIAQKHVASEKEALSNLRTVYLGFIPQLARYTHVPVHFVSYESLQSRRAQLALLQAIDLGSATLKVGDSNAKHYPAHVKRW